MWKLHTLIYIYTTGWVECQLSKAGWASVPPMPSERVTMLMLCTIPGLFPMKERVGNKWICVSECVFLWLFGGVFDSTQVINLRKTNGRRYLIPQEWRIASSIHVHHDMAMWHMCWIVVDLLIIGPKNLNTKYKITKKVTMNDVAKSYICILSLYFLHFHSWTLKTCHCHKHICKVSKHLWSLCFQ